MTAPLMPKATAVWLVDNTMLTFRQIAKFCEIHELEIQAIADGDVAYNIMGQSPIANGQLTLEEIKRCEADPSADLVANVMEKNVKEINARNKKVLTPSQRSDKPSAILWLVHNCPDLTDGQISKLIGTTKPTIMAIRNGTREDMAYLRAKNPVGIQLCTEAALDEALRVAKERLEKAEAKLKKAATKKAKKKTVKKVKVAKKTVAKKTAKKATKKTTKKTATKKVSKKATTKTSAKKVVAKKVKKASAKKMSKKKTTQLKSSQKPTTKGTKKMTEKKPATKKVAPAKKAPAKKVVAKKAPAKKVVAKKAPAKKVVAKKAPAKKVVAKKAPAKKAVAKKAPVKKK